MECLLLATGNPGKLRELRRLLAGLPLRLVTPAELGLSLDVPEDGDTYAENAIAKARAFAAAGGCLALADDSGLEVDALGGRPGVRSARYGGPDLDDRGRFELLLRELHAVPERNRGARYRAVVALAAPADHDGRAVQPGGVVTFEGSVAGTIACAPSGDGGFGYDPVFVLPDGRTAAMLPADEKDRASHRGQAVRAAANFLARALL
ncbi:MAG: non-canonical purine NTP pyrophosphatase [Dehalococcoidia bacterium]|nr:non-canonical purine NTP pyrophosphatase [Dehalococcoidia bacterium]